MTVEGIRKAGYKLDYSYVWSAEACPKDLSFVETEGTINYIFPFVADFKKVLAINF